MTKSKMAIITVTKIIRFQTICNVMSNLGTRFQDAGFRDLFIETGIIRLNKSSYGWENVRPRSLGVYKSIYEAFMRLAWIEFIPWIEKTRPNKTQKVTTFLAEVTEEEQDECKWKTNHLRKFFRNQFQDHYRHDNGGLSSFWMSYVDIVETILLALLRATREGNWQLHLSAIQVKISWCFAYDKVNYARYLPVYYAQLSNLQTRPPGVFQAFLGGHLSVQLSNSNPFGRIPVDHTTEVTVNRHTETRWYNTVQLEIRCSEAVSRHIRTQKCIPWPMREMVNGNNTNVRHVDLQQTRIQKDEDAVTILVSLIQI